LTQTFNHSDISYFFPLMEMAASRLGFKPPFGTADAAFDAFYTFEYFHLAGGFAAIPLRNKSVHRAFAPDGAPLCAAGLPMHLKSSFMNRSSLVIHQRQRWACPLLFPHAQADGCPLDHPKWVEGGCLTTLPTSIGARLRYQIDRDSPDYKLLYNQRTASERIFAQALALGIEQPKLRNQCSITNRNTLIYLLINLNGLQRVIQKRDAGFSC
jgi:hypothetical protein